MHAMQRFLSLPSFSPHFPLNNTLFLRSPRISGDSLFLLLLSMVGKCQHASPHFRFLLSLYKNTKLSHLSSKNKVIPVILYIHFIFVLFYFILFSPLNKNLSPTARSSVDFLFITIPQLLVNLFAFILPILIIIFHSVWI